MLSPMCARVSRDSLKNSNIVAIVSRAIELVAMLWPSIKTHRLDENLRFGKNVQEDSLSERQSRVRKLFMWL